MSLNWDNVIAGNGIGITITGMLIVFSGLALISFFISVLPRILEYRQSKQVGISESGSAQQEACVADQEPTEEELLAIISLVLHEEMERSLGEMSRLTIARQKQHASIWASAGRMRSLSEGGSYASL